MHQGVQYSKNLASLRGDQLEIAILRTVLYSDVFDYPLTLDEVAYYLMDFRHRRDQVRAVLTNRLPECVAIVEDHVTLRGRENLVAKRRDRIRMSRKIWRRARLYSRLLGMMPFIRMVAVTGALAMDNCDENDDVDVLIVTAPARVWLARAFAVLVVRACKALPNTLCPNYVISEDALSLGHRTIYTAHEFVQMVPVYGFEVYRKMSAANAWAREILPNADGPIHWEPEHKPGLLARTLKGILERWLTGTFGDRIEAWEMRRKIRKFEAKGIAAAGSAVFDSHQAKGHLTDHGVRVSCEYGCRLREYRISAPEEASVSSPIDNG